jgi:hypothetical protein
MIDINKEAEEYIENDLELYESLTDGHISYDIAISLLKNIYSAGHNSKATQAKVLQAQIDILREVNINNIDVLYKELQQKLKELENDTIN